MLEEKSSLIEDIDTSNFIQKVVEGSKEKPVIVDFWAPWCNPCKQLTPILEKIIIQMDGKVKLVKVDIDQNQNLAQQMRIQSVPTVLAFSDGKPVNGFSGLKGEEEILNFVMELVTISEHSSDELKKINETLEEAEKRLQNKDYEKASSDFVSILEESLPKELMIKAISGLGKCYIGQNKFIELNELIEQLEDNIKEENEIQDLIKSKNYIENIEVKEVSGLEVQLKDNPNDFDIRYEVARGQIVNKDYSKAIENLLFIIGKNKEWNQNKAKKELLDIFSLLGDSNPLTLEGRAKLSNLIFK
ncbi:MAG: thioredoxin [Pelagibacterales bacterium]|nr:thioredoxin [Pelagibacterales bacterium]OUU63176.1 MAG: thioredoxin [Alphaproteobacteria bacterium TMED62]|tara:strand:- start:12847 stop:13752 length:906 start_codon:yes stop_codon:yes gene_type:complete